MLFVIDVGNTNMVLGIYNKNTLIKNWRIRTIKNITVDEFDLLIMSLFFNNKIKKSKIHRTIISCVVPELFNILHSFCNQSLNHKPSWVNAKNYRKMPILIDNPNELGGDRIVNSVAAYKKYSKSAIIVDFGTATTFDCVSEAGEYIGGVISPGIMISSEALFKKASKLSKVNISKIPKTIIGKDTISSTQSGIIFGYASLVDGLVKKIINEMQTKPIVIATGGLAFTIFKVSKTIEKIEPSLTLEGLKYIGENI